jgi:hypothetical protein
MRVKTASFAGSTHRPKATAFPAIQASPKLNAIPMNLRSQGKRKGGQSDITADGQKTSGSVCDRLPGDICGIAIHKSQIFDINRI